MKRCYDFLFPRLKKLKVYECPNLTTNFDTTPNGSMSARYKISQVAEDSSDDCSVPTNSYRIWTRDDGWEE
ncbi:hypothetical protein NC652_004351 [Populus alba x Populus x berolinensis]|nr:hypothetical protein NC652_004351 [Populus alba x Populus x berolinensis]